jgi:hypothetical protein
MIGKEPPVPDKKLTLDEALALLDKHEADAASATDAEKAKIKKKEKVKDLLKEGAKQGRGGLNRNQRRLLEQIDD